MDPALIILVSLAGLAGLIWAARQYDKAVKRASAQQDLAQVQLVRADELQERALLLMEREDAILNKAEELLERLEQRLSS